MKGLQEKTSAGTTFLVIKHHSLCEESKTERPGFEQITVYNPRTITPEKPLGDPITKYIKKYAGVEALICKVEWYDTEEKYDQRYQGWKIHLNAAGVPCVLDLPFNSRAAGRFMRLAENLDFSEPVEFSAWYDAKNDATAFNVKQFGKSVQQKYTKDNPGDCPQPEKNFQGKLNFDKVNEFLYGRMINVVVPTVEEIGNPMPQLQAQAVGAYPGARPMHVPEEDLQDDDIPF